jgi:hypothetical protein
VINKTCRSIKEHFEDCHDRAMKALSFAKTLRADLEIAADFNMKLPQKDLLQKLQETNHVQVRVVCDDEVNDISYSDDIMRLHPSPALSPSSFLSILLLHPSPPSFPLIFPCHHSPLSFYVLPLISFPPSVFPLFFS